MIAISFSRGSSLSRDWTHVSCVSCITGGFFKCWAFIFLRKPIGKISMGGGSGLVANSCLTLAILWTATCQAPLSVGFSRQECWCGLPFPSPGDLPNPGIEPRSPSLQADDLPTEHEGRPIHRCISTNENSFNVQWWEFGSVMQSQ